MKTRIEKSQDKSTEMTKASQTEFNFELWAKQVRPQLLASVQKRGMR
ncbi:MAG: hypothetical protein NW224_18290 [Leptolyngbyaceae cyanobacterium bins.302]|nr:hypothetical protein [Leptolyngbyaceae cyanobacterium bins.302]